MTLPNRRQFLRGAAAAAGSAAVLPAFERLGFLAVRGRVHAANGDGGYGPLAPVPDLRDGVERIALPEGFQYRSFGIAGETMSDGYPTPLAHDGMAAFRLPNGNTRLIRNHENRNPPGLGSTFGDPTKKYDPLGGGGTTSLELNPQTRELIRDFVSLNGTIVNCAGGLTPWGSWVSCEETTAGVPPWGKKHGYAFEVSALARSPVDAIALNAMGRFAHEALAVNPHTGIAYETEDAGSTSGFYRFRPDRPGQLGSGRLQMLAIKGKPNADLQTGQKVGKPLPVIWVDIEDPDPEVFSPDAVFQQGWALGGAAFNRLEGCWYADGRIYFTSTQGGDAGLGQVWEYRPHGSSGRALTLIFESPNIDVLNLPDNLNVTPRGGILLCEDGDDRPDHLKGLTRDGAIFDFARNEQNDREWAGACFSPDGETLYVNRQGATSFPMPPGDEGMTFAIWGPWEAGPL
jgi:secreted PhoX family phosphatase